MWTDFGKSFTAALVQTIYRTSCHIFVTLLRKLAKRINSLEIKKLAQNSKEVDIRCRLLLGLLKNSGKILYSIRLHNNCF